MLLAAPADVEARLGRTPSTEESGRIPGLLAEASALVEAYLDQVLPDPVPTNAVLVTSRMVARSLSVREDLTGVSQVQQTAGPFSMGRTMTSTAAAGGVYLSRQDRMLLSALRRSGVTSVMLVGEGYEALP